MASSDYETTANIDLRTLISEALPFEDDTPQPPPSPRLSRLPTPIPPPTPRSSRKSGASPWVVPSRHAYENAAPPPPPRSTVDAPPPPPPVRVEGTSSAPTDRPPAARKLRDVEDVTVSEYAELCALRDMRPHELDEIIDAADLSVPRFELVEERWQKAINEELERGMWALGAAFDDAYVARIEAERGVIDVPTYARIDVARERGRSGPLLDELAIPRVAAMPITRCWIRRIAGDFEISDSYAVARRQEVAQ